LHRCAIEGLLPDRVDVRLAVPAQQGDDAWHLAPVDVPRHHRVHRRQGVPVIGASAGVFGVMLAFARFWPNTMIMVWGIIPAPAWLLVIVTTGMSLWGGYKSSDDTAHFAHLGGYVGAFLYLLWWERSRASFKKRAVSGPPEVNQKVEGWRTIDASRVHEVNRAEVVRLLEKASASGVASLTPEERVFLSNFVPKDVVPPPT